MWPRPKQRCEDRVTLADMEARAEAEMRRADRAGLLKGLAGEGKPLEERHVASGGSNSQHAAIQRHVQKETR